MTDWMDFALCRETDPEAFYPELGQPAAPAKRICGRCEVREPCLQYALATFQEHGVWGGLSDRERKRLWGDKPRRLQAYCINGHDMRDPKVAGVKPNGDRWCRPCNAARERGRKRGIPSTWRAAS